VSISKRNINRANDLALTITIKEDGTPVAEAGWTAFCTIKRWFTDSDDDAVYAETQDVDDTTSVAVFDIDSVDTDITPGLYYYDLKTKDPQGKLQNTDSGIVQIHDTITKRIS
jgi:hypothetical protein